MLIIQSNAKSSCFLYNTAKQSRCVSYRAKIVSEYDQEIPKSQTADKPMASRGRATQQS